MKEELERVNRVRDRCETHEIHTTWIIMSLLFLPQELQLSIFCAVHEWNDRAALCLALPPIGVQAIRTIETCPTIGIE